MPKPTPIENFTHDEAKRSNIPTAEFETLVPEEQQAPVKIAYKKRDPDLDPQLVWRGKFDGDDELVVKAPPLYIQEKIHPRALIEDLRKETAENGQRETRQANLFGDFNGFPKDANRTDFYQHEHNWTNRMILGDSLQVMASLAERENLRGQVQFIYYIDPPYGIKFNSNFQWSTTSRDVKDGKLDNFTREPEQVKAFRDTWRDGIHSYLSYLRDRLIVSRDLLTESGSVFVQIGDENAHRVRALMDEIFGENNFVSQISFATTTGFSGLYLSSIFNHVIWYAKNINELKYNQLYSKKVEGGSGASKYKPVSSFMALKDTQIAPARLVTSDQLTSQGAPAQKRESFKSHNKEWDAPRGLHWKTTIAGLERLDKAGRIIFSDSTIRYLRFIDDFAAVPLTNFWNDIGGVQSRVDPKIYVVQTSTEVIARCLLMASDPGDLVLDPTCGSGTTAYVAEQWGRRWITIDTSRVALALARARLMGARYPYYILSDSPEGQSREAQLSGKSPVNARTCGDLSLGFVYERVPHITLKSIANNADIDEIHARWQEKMEPMRDLLNALSGEALEEWEIPRPADKDSPEEERKRQAAWPDEAKKILAKWWQAPIDRQKEIDASIAARADYEYLYDKPYEDKKKVRVAGPFTVESASPHRMLAVGANDEVIDPAASDQGGEGRDFAAMILENLKTAGVQQAHKQDKITFTSLTPFEGKLIAAEGIFQEGENEKRAAIVIGPEFGAVGVNDLVDAAREAPLSAFDALIVCAFNFEGSTSSYSHIGKLPVIQARMNADLHMSYDLKNTGKGNLFVVFGEPDIDIVDDKDARGRATGKIRVRIKGVDVYYPGSGEIRSDNTDNIACWFVDTDYDNQSFFVRQAYFLGQNDPYKALRTTLKAEIDPDAWASLHRNVSRAFAKPKNGKIAVKVINHLGDEAMKVFEV